MAVRHRAAPAPIHAATIATVNVGGVKRKVHALRNFLIQDGIHIAALTETKLKQKFSVSNFNCFQRNSTAGVHACRGVALLINTQIPAREHTLPQHLADLECVAADVTIDNITITIIVNYTPPRAQFPHELLIYTASLNNAILLGDFNARHVEFGDTASNPLGNSLTEALFTHGLFRLNNTFPTLLNHAGSSIIDHIIATENLAHKLENPAFLGTTVTSDHIPLCTRLFTTRQIIRSAPNKITIKDTKHANWNKFQAHLSDNRMPITKTNNTRLIDKQVHNVTKNIQAAYDHAVPTKTLDINRRPLPRFIISDIKRKRHLYREFINHRDPLIKTEWNRLNAKIRRDINAFKEKKWVEICSQLDYRDGQKFWNKFKILTGQKSDKNHPLTDATGQVLTTPEDKAQCFASSLAQTYQVPCDPSFDDITFLEATLYANELSDTPLPDNPPAVDPIMGPVTPNELKSFFPTLKCKKAPGQDGLVNKAIKHLPDPILEDIAQMFNNCLQTCYFPSDWKKGSTIMIPKPNKQPSDPASYRPITLLPALGKLFEKILAARLRESCEESGILPASQFGFRSNRSTIDPLIALQTDLSRFHNLGQCTVAAFLDTERAFDKVWHDGLLYKMHKLNFDPRLIKLIQSFLKNRTTSIKVKNAESDPINLHAGVPQGAVLSPLLYIIYVSDMPTVNNEIIKTKQFADDTAIWASQPDVAAAVSCLQPILNEISFWASKWRIKTNAQKSSAVIFCNGHQARGQKFNPAFYKLQYNNLDIPLKDEATYLGIKFHKFIALKPDIDAILIKVRKRAKLLSMLTSKLNGCSSKTLLHTYKCFIRPLLDYRAPVYAALNKKQISRLEACERKILRRIFRLHYKYPSNLVHAKTNCTPISHRLTELQSRYVNRAIIRNQTPVLETLQSSWRSPTFSHYYTSRRNLPKKPSAKKRFLPAALIHAAITHNIDLPPELILSIENCPLSIR